MIYFESLSPHFSLATAPLVGFIEGYMKFIDLPLAEVYDLKTDPQEENDLAPGSELLTYAQKLDELKKSLKGRGTKQDVEGKRDEIRPLLASLGYISGRPPEKKNWGVQDDPKALMPLVAQLRLATEEFKAGKVDQAIKKLNNIIRIRPNYVSAFCNLASAYFILRRGDEALATLEQGLEKNPDNLQLAARLGIMLVLAKRYAEAVEPLEYAVKREETNPDYFNYLGMAYMGLGQFELAREKFEQALKLDRDLTSALNNLGYLNLALYRKEKNDKYLDLAIENFDLALKYKPDLEAAARGKEIALQYRNQRDFIP